MSKSLKRILSFVLVFAMVFGMFGQSALAMGAETGETEKEIVDETETEVETKTEVESETVLPNETESETETETETAAVMAADKAVTYEFGSAKTVLKPGKYNLPLKMNKADKPNDSSMAGTCIKSAVLTVAEDGSAKVTINLGAVSVGAISGWGSDWKIYTEYGFTNEKALVVCDKTTNEQGEADSISFALPDNSWDGVYTHMHIAVMSTDQDAYFAMDFANATPYVEPVPVSFSAGNNGKVIATVKNREIASGDLVKVGEEVVFTAKPDTGYAVDAWTGVEGSGNSVKVTVKEALNVNVTFKEKELQKYAVVFNGSENGTLTATVNGQEIKSGDMVEENASVIFTAVPNDGYRTEWFGVVSEDNVATAVVTKALNVKANFLPILDRTKLDEAITAADAIVDNKADYANDEKWTKFEEKLKYAKEHKFTSQDLVDGTVELLTMYQNNLTKLDKVAFKASYDKLDKMAYEMKQGYPLDLMIDVRGTYFDVYDYVVPRDKKRAKDQKEIDDLTAKMDAAIKIYEDYQASAKDLASVVKADGTVTNYKTLRGAVDAATAEDTVKLLGDLTTATGLYKGKNLDLNGFTLTNKSYKTADFAFHASNEVVPKNGILNADVLVLIKDVTLTKGLTVNGLIKSKSKITVDGAVLNAPKGSDLFGFDYYGAALPEVVVNSGTLNAPDGYAIKQCIGEGGKITKITVNGGTLIGNEYAIKGVENITINGGEFKAVNAAVLGGKVITPEGKKLSTVADENGLFKLIASDITENTKMVISVDGKEYAKAEEAFKNITDGAVVKLLADAEVSEYAEIAKSCTFDLNGHRLRVHPFNHDFEHKMGDGGVWCTLKILEGAKVDFVDNSQDKSGVLAQTGASGNDSGIMVYGELTATDIKCDNQNTYGNGSLIIPYNTGKAKVTLDNVKLADGNRSVIVGGGNESGDVFIKNITETFDGQSDTILGSDSLGRNAYTIENCNFTDAGSKREFPDNLTIRNTVWNFTKGGKIGASCYENNRQAIFENATITTAHAEEAVYVAAHQNAVFKNCTIKNTEGYAVTFDNYGYKHYTIESGTYEGKDYAINSSPFFYVTGGEFKGAKGAAKGLAGCPEGKELKLSSNGYYTLQDGEGFKFAPANGKEVAIYAENGELLGGVDLASDDILMAPNHSKLVLQKDIVVKRYAKLSMLYGGELTLDLNGHNISFVDDSDYISIYNGTGVTIIDSKDTAVIDLIPTSYSDYAGGHFAIGADEGTYLNIAGGHWKLMLLVNGSAGKINVTGGHFDVEIQTDWAEEPVFLRNANAAKLTGGDFSYDVSKQIEGVTGLDENWQPIFGVVCDPVPHDTHATYEKDGRWYVVAKEDLPAPETPVITPESKKVKAGETVEVSIAEVKDAKVYYATDGSIPTSKRGTLYEKPFTVDKTTTVKAIAISDVNGKLSTVAEAVYTFVTPDTALLEKAKAESKKDIYTDESLKALNAAIESAQKVFDNKDAAADDIAKANAELDAAVKALAVKPADYSKVDAALKTIPEDLSNYTEATVKAVTEAKDAVVRDLDITKQSEVDAMAEAIEKAVKALTLKPADYSKVDAALKTIPEDLSSYTDATVKAVTEAKDAVVRDLDITKQGEVDAMAEAIEKAVKALEVKDLVKAFVERLYTEVLGREAEENGLNEWTEVLKSKKETGAKVAMGFVDSDEFKKKDMTDEEFLQIMYRTFLGRKADDKGLAEWKKVLDEGMSRMFVFRGFVESDEFTKICESYNIVRGNVDLKAPMDQRENEDTTKFVARLYKVFLGRKADADGINGWVSQLVSKANNAKQAARGFVMSDEFQGKDLSNEEYVKTIYIGILNREADPEGLADWVKVLENGGSRLDIFNGFADSPEFRELADHYGLANDWKAN